MARGGSRGRRSNYVRDNSGRFASTPGGGPPKRSTPATRRAAMRKARPTVTGGTLGARGSLRRSRAKLAGKNPADRSLRGSLSLRAQKGAVTRGANRLGKVRAASTVRMAARAGVIRGGRKVAAKPVASAAPKPSTPARKPAALKWEKPAGSGGRRQTASLPGGRRVNVYSDGKGVTASIFNERDRSPVMDRKDFRNVTEAKKWAANPSARGPRILGRYQPSMKRRKAWEMPTDASPGLANIQGKKARPSGTIAKPRGLKPGAIAARKAKAGVGRQGQQQRAEARAIANYNRSIKAQPETKKQAGRAAIGQVTATRAVEFLRGVKRIGPQRGMTSRVLPKGFVPQSRPGVPAPTAQPRPDRKPSGENQKPKRKTAAQKPTRSPSRLPQETRSALRDIAGRRVQAEQVLTGQIQKLGGITKQQAQAVFNYYSKRKFIKTQGIDGVGVRSGNLLDKDTIRQALQLAQEPAQPRKPRRR